MGLLWSLAVCCWFCTWHLINFCYTRLTCRHCNEVILLIHTCEFTDPDDITQVSFPPEIEEK